MSNACIHALVHMHVSIEKFVIFKNFKNFIKGASGQMGDWGRFSVPTGQNLNKKLSFEFSITPIGEKDMGMFLFFLVFVCVCVL